jgi:hypothetical protein
VNLNYWFVFYGIWFNIDLIIKKKVACNYKRIRSGKTINFTTLNRKMVNLFGTTLIFFCFSKELRVGFGKAYFAGPSFANLEP